MLTMLYVADVVTLQELLVQVVCSLLTGLMVIASMCTLNVAMMVSHCYSVLTIFSTVFSHDRHFEYSLPACSKNCMYSYIIKCVLSLSLRT